MKFGWLAVILALALTCGAGAAQAANPVLGAKVYGAADTDAHARALRISRLDVRVVLAGGAAQTTVEASFDNPTGAVLEGDFVLALPAGAVVNGYGLDVGGKLVDGVLTGKRQAERVYEDRVRRGIDPGLAEVTAANDFHTRVYPIMPGRSRTVRIAYVSPLAGDGGFVLPLESDAAVGDAKLTVQVLDARAVPSVAGPDGLALAFVDGPDGPVATASAKNVTLKGALRVGSWTPAALLQLSRHANGERFFELRLPFDAHAALVRRLRIYWDRSRSRRDDDLKAEIAVLARYIDEARPERVEIVAFADDAPRTQVLAAPTGAALAEALNAVSYGGASSLDGLFTAGSGAADTCVFVSDGRMTLGSWSAAPPACRTFTLTSARDADRGFLGALAERGGGRLIDLAAIDQAAALARLTTAGPPAFTLAGDDGQAVEHRLLAGPSGRYWIIGKTPAAGAMVFTGADGKAQSFPLAGLPVRDFDAIGALWGREQIAGLLATDRPDRDEALAIARRYNVAGGHASFVVLENAQDYADAGVAPTASAGEQIIAAYRDAMRARKQEETEAQAERLDRILDQWRAQKAWWSTAHHAGPPVHKGGISPHVAPAPPPPPPVAAAAVDNGGTHVEEFVVTGARAPARPGNVADIVALPQAFADRQTIAVEAAAWNPDRPYLKALAAGPAEGWSARFAAQEQVYGDAPAFYFDVAESLFRAGRRAEAARVALNAIDLPGADDKTLIILADRLQRYGELDRAVWLYERLLFLEPERPQPRRNLALALIARAEAAPKGSREADYRRALDLLNEVIVHPWDDDFDGVEIIALMEANHLVAEMKAQGLSQSVLDPRLTALLDVDIRAVLEWNTDATDMDLWVDEPTGERAIYSNPNTRIGGRLSNDMTAGYGPEEYLLHHAPTGDYVVRANVFASDRLDPNGPTTVRVRLFRGWGRPGEQHQDLEIELKPADEGAKLVGRFHVGPASAAAAPAKARPAGKKLRRRR